MGNSDATRDELPALLAHIRREHAPRTLSAWLRTVVDRGDLQDILDAARTAPPPPEPEIAPRDRKRCPEHRMTMPCQSCAADAKAAEG